MLTTFESLKLQVYNCATAMSIFVICCDLFSYCNMYFIF